MKSRSPDEQIRQPLPPPPAPTARDANAWPTSSPPGGAKHEPRHPRAPGWPPTPRAPRQRDRTRPRSLPWIPLLILFAIVGTAVQTAIRALSDGEVETAIGALVMLAVVSFVALRRILRNKE